MKMAVFALMGALSLLFSPAQGDAAVGASVSGCLRDKGVTETGAPQQTLALRHVEVLWHEHKESCHRAGSYRGDSEESRYGAWRWRFGAGGRPVEN